MIGESAFLASLVLLVLAFLALDQLAFLTPYRRAIFDRYLWHLAAVVAVLFINLFALFYLVGRRILLRDTGRKLAHVEKQLHAGDTIVGDLADRLVGEE